MINFFVLSMFMATMTLGLIWLLEKKVWKPARVRAASSLAQPEQVERVSLILERPVLTSFCCLMFPVFLYVLLIRSFIFEIYRIPSESMMPTLNVGDTVLIDKSIYQFNEPLFHKTMLVNGEPQRGDVVVFQLPENPGINYIKRIVGVPGDKIVHEDKVFMVFSAHNADSTIQSVQKKQDFKYMIDPEKPTREASFYIQEGQPLGVWVVPEDHYFVLGDNRDSSQDSRFWGFVPRTNLVGKVFTSW